MQWVTWVDLLTLRAGPKATVLALLRGASPPFLQNLFFTHLTANSNPLKVTKAEVPAH